MVRETFTWFGERFIKAVNERLTEIAGYPDRYAKRKAEFREVVTKIFPYIIIYEFLEKDRIVFVSYIFHSKRNPKLKYRRKR
jgi:hypothetical protein